MRLKAPVRPCLGAGCGRLIDTGRPRCPECETKAQRAGDRARGSSWRRGYDTDWIRLRDMYIRANPLCEDCLEHNRLVATDEVHHKIPISERPDLRLVWDNLRGLCKPCHSSITARAALVKRPAIRARAPRARQYGEDAGRWKEQQERSALWAALVRQEIAKLEKRGEEIEPSLLEWAWKL